MLVCSPRVGFCIAVVCAALQSLTGAAAEEKGSTTAAKPMAAAAKPATPAEKYRLEYKFKPGETLRWDVVHKATVKTTVQGTTQTAWTSSSSVKVWRIENVAEDGEITFTHLVERVQMANQISGRAKVEWDSTSKADVPHGYQDAAKAVGVPLTEVRMDANGKVLQRLEKLNQPGASSDTPITIPLPPGPVAVGGFWLEPHELKLALKGGGSKNVQTRRRFELKSVKNGVAVISVDFQVLTPLQDPTLEAQLVQRMAKGEVRFDVTAGRILSQKFDVDKRLHEFSGPSSLMHHVSRFTEELTDGSADQPKAEQKVATKPAEETPTTSEKK
jgi:hypothetical protein